MLQFCRAYERPVWDTSRPRGRNRTIASDRTPAVLRRVVYRPAAQDASPSSTDHFHFTVILAMPRVLLRLLLLLCVLAPPSLAAQQADPLTPGTRVRVILARGSRSIWSRPQILQGTVTAVSADSLSLRLDAEAGPVTLATASVAKLEVSQGIPSRLESAVWQGAVIGLQGATTWPAVRDRNFDNSDSWERDVLVGAAVGAAVGVVLGALNPAERWRRARKGPAPGEFTIPRPVPGPRIAVGGGLALLDEGRGSGAGQHLQAIVRLTPRASFLNLRGELLHARSDRTRQYGAGISAAGDAPFTWGPFQPYGIPLGIGVYHRQTSDTIRATGFGVNFGGGLRTRVGDAQVFTEFRAYTIMERDGYSGFVPLTFGISF